MSYIKYIVLISIFTGSIFYIYTQGKDHGYQKGYQVGFENGKKEGIEFAKKEAESKRSEEIARIKSDHVKILAEYSRKQQARIKEKERILNMEDTTGCLDTVIDSNINNLLRETRNSSYCD